MTTPPYPLQPQPLHRGWLDRHPLWKIPAGLLTLFLLLGAFGGIVITLVVGSFRNSDVYKEAIVRASENLQLRDQIGEPIKASWLVSGQLNVNGSVGNANLAIPIRGPKGSAVVRAIASKSNGAWTFRTLLVEVQGHPGTIDLLSPKPPEERDF